MGVLYGRRSGVQLSDDIAHAVASTRSSRFCRVEMELVLEGHLWEALWPYISVQEILQLRTSARVWNKTSEYGPHCDLFFLMKSEPTKGEEPIGVSCKFSDYMRAGDQHFVRRLALKHVLWGLWGSNMVALPVGKVCFARQAVGCSVFV